jgi:predicted kinase
MLLIICGLPGVGKTTLAKAIAKRFHLVHLNSDIIRKKHFRRRTYSEREKMRVYDLLFYETEKHVRNGNGVVVDATFYKNVLRKKATAIAKKYKTKFFIIECTLDESELKKRIERRKKTKNASEADWTVYLKIKKQYEPIKEKHLTLNTALALTKQLKMVKEWISTKSKQ